MSKKYEVIAVGLLFAILGLSSVLPIGLGVYRDYVHDVAGQIPARERQNRNRAYIKKTDGPKNLALFMGYTYEMELFRIDRKYRSLAALIQEKMDTAYRKYEEMCAASGGLDSLCLKPLGRVEGYLLEEFVRQYNYDMRKDALAESRIWDMNSNNGRFYAAFEPNSNIPPGSEIYLPKRIVPYREANRAFPGEHIIKAGK